MAIYGNHGPSMFADFFHASATASPMVDLPRRGVAQGNLPADRLEAGQGHHQRACLVQRRRAASAAIDHMATWWNGTADGDFASMAMPSAVSTACRRV